MSGRITTESIRLEDVIAAGQAALEDGRFEEAANHFRQALRSGPRSSDEEAEIRCLLSEAFEKRSFHQEQFDTVSKYEKQTELARLSDKGRMQALIQLGRAYAFNNDIPRAIAFFNQAMQIARKLDDTAGIGYCYFGLGRAYRSVSEIRIAHDYFTSALEYFRKVGNWRSLAESYFHIGVINLLEGDYRNVLSAVKQVIAIIGDRNEHELLGRAYLNLGLANDNLGAPNEEVISSYETALEHFRRAGNNYYLGINYNNLSMKLVWLGQWDRAEQLALEALSVLRAAENSMSERILHAYAASLDTLGLLYILKGMLNEADAMLQESLKIFERMKITKDALRREHPNEAETYISLGRCCLARGNPAEAVEHLERALDICTRLGDRQFLFDAWLWLAEALIETGQVERARAHVESAQELMRELPDLFSWGLMMRVLAKVEAADGHIASAIQSLGQSTSIYQMKGCVHDCALNRVVLAGLMEWEGRIARAIGEAESALSDLEQLGATIDARNARAYLDSLREKQATLLPVVGVDDAERVSPDLVSALDGFIAQRIVQASVSRELLLQEVVSIAREQSASRAALIVEVPGDNAASKDGANLKRAASVGLSESETDNAIGFLSNALPDEQSKNFVYRFGDGQNHSYLLHLIEPRAQRFLSGDVNTQPLFHLVEQSLELCSLRARNRRAHIFEPAKLLSQVEIPGFICASRAMSHVLEQIHKIRSSDVTVLITGESGTGKELIARAVHAGSSRRTNVFLPFNCSAAPRDMIESQLFGYRRGAFTGAVADNSGIIRAAQHGTLFLDEIGDLPLDLQPKLLRFLQEGEVHPIGESQPLRVDVRVVAATNSELERAVAEGRFREDLFHRLNVIRIHVPALRQRREEIPALVNHYLVQYQQDSAKREIKVSEEAIDLMVVYDWPGNVRQLCNEMRRIVAYGESGAIIMPSDLSPEILQASRNINLASPKKPQVNETALAPGTTLAEAMEELERRMIQDALRRSSGNIARAAKELGLSRKGLYLKMDRLNFNI